MSDMEAVLPAASPPVGSSPAGSGFSLKPLMAETFFCSMSMMAFVALAGPIARLVGLAPWHVGAAMTIAGIAWMVMARFWGARSDRLGRRRVLLTGLTGFAVSYFLLVLFIDTALHVRIAPMLVFAGLLVGRGVAGAFYAAVPTSSAALVADHVPPERRGPAMAAIGAASAAGMVIGPGLAGLVAPISLSLPLYVTAILPTLGLLLLWRVLPRDDAPAQVPGGARRLFDPRLRFAMLTAFAAMFSVAIAQICVGFFALDRLGLAPASAARTAGLALAVVGVALVCAQLMLRHLGWPPMRLVRVGCIIGAAGFGSVMLAGSPAMLWVSYGVAAFGMGWVFPSVSAIAANAVEPQEQGIVAGTIAAAQGLGVVAGPLVGSFLYMIDPGAPFALIALILLMAAIPAKAARAG